MSLKFHVKALTPSVTIFEGRVFTEVIKVNEVMRAVILVALVIKLNGGLMGNAHFPRMCWVKCRFLETLSEAGQRWQRIQSQNRGGMSGGGKTQKETFCKNRVDNI